MTDPADLAAMPPDPSPNLRLLSDVTFYRLDEHGHPTGPPILADLAVVDLCLDPEPPA